MLCKTLGDACGPVLEHRYRTFIARADIDTLASVGVSILRIPTTYNTQPGLISLGLSCILGIRERICGVLRSMRLAGMGCMLLLMCTRYPGG
jgi:hypothetical protein